MTLVLLVMVILVALSNDARGALQAERQAYNVALVVAASMPAFPPEATWRLLDEEVRTSGSIIIASGDWPIIRSTSCNIVAQQPDAAPKGENSAALSYARTGAGVAAPRRLSRDKAGLPILCRTSPTGPALSGKLPKLPPASKRARQRIWQSQIFSAQADRLTDWLSYLCRHWCHLLALVAVQAIRRISLPGSRPIPDRARRSVNKRSPSERRASGSERSASRGSGRAAWPSRPPGSKDGGGQRSPSIAHDFNNMLAVWRRDRPARRRLNGPRREISPPHQRWKGNRRRADPPAAVLARSALLPETVDSSELVAGMSDLLDRTLGERIQVEVDLAADSWPTYVDRTSSITIVNLAVNARCVDGSAQCISPRTSR
jgi:hypothetical protein